MLSLFYHVLYFQCITLEDFGYNSLVVITIEQRHIEIGSTKGRRFYKENFDMIEKFVEFCKGTCNCI